MTLDRGLAVQVAIWAVGAVLIVAVAASIIQHPPVCGNATSTITSKDQGTTFIMAGNVPIFSTHYYFHLANGATQEVEWDTYNAYSVGQNYTYRACTGGG